MREKEAYSKKWNVLVQCSSKKSALGLLCKWYKSRHLRRFLFKDVYSRKKYLLKIFTELVHILIRVRKIFNCNILFEISLSQCLVIVANELWTWLDKVVSEWYFRKKYHNSDGSRFHLVARSKQKIKMETECHGIFISIFHFSLVWLIEFSIIYPWLDKVEVLPITPTWQS